MTTCRLLQDSGHWGSMNMAIDEAILRHTDSSPAPITTLRLYTWRKPTVSIGYAQHPQKALNLKYCVQHGLEIVRRPTGGRAVLHADELTYSVVSNDLEVFGGDGIRETYLTIGRILQQALVQIGCPAELSPGNINRKYLSLGTSDKGSSPMGTRSVAEPCFSSTSKYEITAGGRKLIGSAQRRLKRAFLQHGSIIIGCDYEFQAVALAADPLGLKQSFVGIKEYCAVPNYEIALRRFIPESFKDTLGMAIQEGALHHEESLAAAHYDRTGYHRIRSQGLPSVG